MASDVPRALRELVYARDLGLCQRCGRYCLNTEHSLQHRCPRQIGGDAGAHTAANLILLCGSATTRCHGHVESRRTEAYAEGFLVERGQDPATVPVLRFRRVRELPGETWTPLEVVPPCPDPWSPLPF